ncbi:MAG: homoserine O-succinyltransferase [Sphingobium sp.]
MPIKIADDLPARPILEAEGIVVMRETDAVRQDIRPLRIALLNLMPNKIDTETQLARLVGATPLQVELTLVRITDHESRNTSADHMRAFYRPWRDVRDARFDGLVITGAPVEHLPFEEVGYWRELQTILDWTQAHVHRTFAICWAAQAALHHFHGVAKHVLDRKALGVFRHRNLAPSSPYLLGFSDDPVIPVSRRAEIRRDALLSRRDLRLLLDSEDAGPCLVHDPRHGFLHMFNHLEYDTRTLADEYLRDGGRQMPAHYFPDDDPARPPRNRWRSHAHLLMGNWINDIYQTTPFDPKLIGSVQRADVPTA